MSKYLIIFIISFTTSLAASATNYYIDTTGNDANTGLTTAAPWKTITKLNSSMASLIAGDTVFFKRGQRFYGTITITKSGSVANPIIYDAYGTGKAPEITGFYPITTWTTVPGYTNVWQATLPFSRTSVNMLTKNNAIQPLGRWPNYNGANGGYRSIISCTSNTSLTDASNFPSSFVGGEAVVRTERWILDRGTVAAQSGKVLTLTPQGSSYPFIAGFGYFIQNHINCLDVAGEWAFNSAANKIYIYSTTNPNSDVIEASMLDETVHSIDNITWLTHNNYKIRNLNFTGSNKTAMSIWLGSNVTFENDSVYNHGFDGINFYQCNNFKIRNCFFNHIDNNAIRFEDSNTDSLENNIIKNIAMIPGKGGSGDVNYLAIRLLNSLGASNSVISYNTIDSVGECGISFGNTDMTVSYNKVSNISMVLDDIGAIYAVGTGNGNNCKVFNNVCFNNWGCIFGTNVTQSQSKSAGIYLDEGTAGVSVYNNTCYNNAWGMMLNNSNTHSISDNTLSNNRLGVFFSSYASPFVSANYFKYNTIFTKDSTQLLLNINTPSFAGTSGLGNLDSNYYGRPLKRTSITSVTETSPSYSSVLGLPAFNTRYGFDAHTYLHPTQYANVLIDTLMFFYCNTTLNPVTITLPSGGFIDAKGVTLSGSFLLQPFTSRIVLKISNAILPVTLLSFSGKANECNALLSWKTASEINAAQFEIEQSNNGIDFFKITSVKADGGSGDHNYSINIGQQDPINYYRLKMIDYDGQFKYSPVQQVKINCGDTRSYFNVYPNPVKNGEATLNFKIQYEGIANMTIVSTTGQIVAKRQVTVNSGDNNIPLKLYDLTKGIYFIKLLSADGRVIAETQKIINN